MKTVRSMFIAGIMALFGSSAQAVLVTFVDISVGGVDYTATFHDFDTAYGFYQVWDTDGNGTFGDGINASFNKTPTFWGDPTGAAAARDAIIAALGTADWVDESGGYSDGFFVPSAGPSASFVNLFYDGNSDPFSESPADSIFAKSGNLDVHWAWVTFDERITVPEPVTPALLLSGLLVGWVVRRRSGRV